MPAWTNQHYGTTLICLFLLCFLFLVKNCSLFLQLESWKHSSLSKLCDWKSEVKTLWHWHNLESLTFAIVIYMSLGGQYVLNPPILHKECALCMYLIKSHGHRRVCLSWLVWSEYLYFVKSSLSCWIVQYIWAIEKWCQSSKGDRWQLKSDE